MPENRHAIRSDLAKLDDHYSGWQSRINAVLHKHLRGGRPSAGSAAYCAFAGRRTSSNNGIAAMTSAIISA